MDGFTARKPLAQLFFVSLNSLSWPKPDAEVLDSVFSQLPLGTVFQALAWWSRKQVPAQVVPAQVVPAPAAQSF